MGKAKPAEKPASADAANGSAPQPDPRDAEFARLERAVAEERQNATQLREANGALTFKLEIMEKGYSKQLADARKKMESAVQELATLKAQIAENGAGGEETRRMLAETRAELSRVKADRNLLKDQASRSGGPKSVVIRGGDDGDTSSTINAMILGAGNASSRDRAVATDSNQSQRVRAADDAPSVDMVAPDLIFTKGDKDE
jgi:hypothetical protein